MWVWIFGGLALVGAIVLVCYGVWLTHKVSDVMSEVRVLSERGGLIADELAKINVPDRFDAATSHSGSTAAEPPGTGGSGVL